MKRYFQILKQDCVNEGKVPIYIVRYEDLVMEQDKTLEGLFSFLLSERDIAGTNMAKRIQEVGRLG